MAAGGRESRKSRSRRTGGFRAARPVAASSGFWIFGLHAVRNALENPRRKKLRLIATRNAQQKLADAIEQSGLVPELADSRAFPAPLDPSSVHQGAALEVEVLEWGSAADVCGNDGAEARTVAILDRISDPRNVGAVLRAARVFGARAVIAPRRHAPPETGGLAKAASGALEHVPYLRVQNLAREIAALRDMGYTIIGLDADGEAELDDVLRSLASRRVALALGSEGSGLRVSTKSGCDLLARIAPVGAGTLNVSSAAAIALYAASGAGSVKPAAESAAQTGSVGRGRPNGPCGTAPDRRGND